MPSASTSTFMIAQCVEIVLVPFDEEAVFHRGGTDGHGPVQLVAGQHKAADMLGEMAGKAHQSVGEECTARSTAALPGSQSPWRT